MVRVHGVGLVKGGQERAGGLGLLAGESRFGKGCLTRLRNGAGGRFGEGVQVLVLGQEFVELGDF